MKKVMVIVLAVGAIIATIPVWGGCDLNARLCTTWCSIKHLNSDMKAAGCRTRCSMENANCHSREAAEGINDFVKGFQGK